MKATLKAASAALAMFLLCACVVPASAGCAPSLGPKLKPQSWNREGVQSGRFTLVSTEAASDSIVGFWQVALTSDGTPIDAGYVQWHSDGTEIMNSSRAPATQSFCLGVWKKVGNVYKLNHFALSFDANGNEIGPANIRETVSLASGGQSYSGNFTIDQYDTSGNLLVHIAGTVTGTRITVDTPPSKL